MIKTQKQLVRALDAASTELEILDVLSLVKPDSLAPYTSPSLTLDGISIDRDIADTIISICEKKGYRPLDVISWEKLQAAKAQIDGAEPETEELAKYRALWSKSKKDDTRWVVYGRDSMKAYDYASQDIQSTCGRAAWLISHALMCLRSGETLSLGFRELALDLIKNGS